MAFLTIITNKKSLLHWKRVLALHKNIGIQKANQIIEYSNDVMNSINELVDNNTFFKQNLSEFKTVIN